MATWLVKIGIALIVIGVGLLTPLYDYMPIQFWDGIKAIIGLGPPLKGGKIIEVERNLEGEFGSIGIGFILVSIGFFIRYLQKNKIEK